MHPVQKDILICLMQNPTGQRFSELLPENLKTESERFNYHLKQLVKLALVSKENEIYTLSTKGLMQVSNITATGSSTHKFKVSVALIIERNTNGTREFLVQKRLRHPFYGDINGIAGKVEKGESILSTAPRKLKEETALTVEFKHIGILRKIKRDDSLKILEDTFYHYCIGSEPIGELEEENKYGENFWIKENLLLDTISKSIDIGKLDIQILQRIIERNHTFFYLEQDSVVKEYTKQA